MNEPDRPTPKFSRTKIVFIDDAKSGLKVLDREHLAPAVADVV